MYNPTACVRNSLIASGSIVNGYVENSVLSANVRVEKGARVQYSVLMPGAVVKSGATVKYAIIGENTEIGEEAVVGCAPYQGEGWGIATCGPDLKIRPGAQVPANAMIYTSEEV